MEFVINHKRFSKTYENEEAKKYSFSENRIRRFPDYVPGYYNFFTHHAQKNYKLEKIKCICGEENDLILYILLFGSHKAPVHQLKAYA